jgi:hypothetical protein
MDLDQVELTLLPAPDDPERICYEIQAKLFGIHENLRKHGVDVTRVGAHPAGGTHVGQFNNNARPCRNRSYSGGCASVGTDAVRSEDLAQIR